MLIILTIIVVLIFTISINPRSSSCSGKGLKRTLCFFSTQQQTKCHKYKENLVIFQSIGIIVIKSRETRVVTYTCRYSSGHLILNSSWHDWIIGIKCPLEYLQVYRWPPLATTLVSLLFIYMILIACKITDFSFYLFFWNSPHKAPALLFIFGHTSTGHTHFSNNEICIS